MQFAWGRNLYSTSMKISDVAGCTISIYRAIQGPLDTIKKTSLVKGIMRLRIKLDFYLKVQSCYLIADLCPHYKFCFTQNICTLKTLNVIELNLYKVKLASCIWALPVILFAFLEDLAAQIDKNLGKFAKNLRIHVLVGYFENPYVVWE